MGNYALMNGVTVNVISISDDDCRLENVGRVADMTGGNVDKIDALEVTQNRRDFAESRHIATNVNAHDVVHRGLKLGRLKTWKMNLAIERKRPMARVVLLFPEKPLILWSTESIPRHCNVTKETKIF